MTAYLATLPGHLLEEPKRALVFLLLGFILSFTTVRLATRRARAGERDGQRGGSFVTPGGLHVHHSVFGIVGMIVFGILEFAMQPVTPLLEFFAFAFGTAAALTLDEFALILHLEDVYWTGEGRAVHRRGDPRRDLHDAAAHRPAADEHPRGGRLHHAVTVDRLRPDPQRRRVRDRELPQGQAVHGDSRHLRAARGRDRRRATGASRVRRGRTSGTAPSRPSSSARASAKRISTRWRERKYAVWDLIGGKPHLHLPHRDRRKRAGGAGRGGSPDPKV